ncbi:DUF2975 domain-containing protein [Flavobacterium silvisoli]|uniref:DUF2975 domain-containing protein n=1 Tax=Flavobacterium silvisoli TaxID=2529433 RepID=A0A4Q9Z3K7_9FLAO|nr:DUF2975 domain-containing protein [Flavobacterium silvisoli]TBX70728.1 DUF2975 domain-containing protein [Flavobacterium silvisoli]
MKKLHLLKTIVDFIWIMSLFCYPLILVFAVMVLIDKEPFDIPITMMGTHVDINNTWGKLALALCLANFGLLLYAVYFFRKLLKSFSNREIFEGTTCHLLDKIGTLVMVSSFIYLLTDLISNLKHGDISIQFGYGPFLYLLALGLFFKVLSEVFTMAKTMKEENELTI